MTIDEKIQAVEDFLDWREQSGATDPIASSVERWRSSLQAQADFDLLRELRKEAEFARGNAEDALALMEKIIGG
ncbi:hypothetical protein [Microbacterium sp.]|uniref:hypothetical protein n=1 Tax=Microbacterium sp. TaxID=51671 RepID=UPI0039E36450